MKVTKKNGETFECTPREYKELKEMGLLNGSNGNSHEEEIKNETTPVNIPIQLVVSKKKSYKRIRKILRINHQYILDNCMKRPEAISKELGIGLSTLSRYIESRYGGFMKLRRSLGHKSYVRNRKKAPRLGFPAKDDNDKRVIRGKFIATRAKYYTKTYLWGWEKAWAQAAVDYNNNMKLMGKSDGSQQSVTVVTALRPWPEVFPLNKEGNIKLMYDVKNMIERVIQQIDYTTATQYELIDGKTWDFNLYNEFIQQFIQNGRQICAYLSKPNKLKISGTGRDMVIIYT